MTTAGDAAARKTLPARAEMSEDWMKYDQTGGKRSSLFKVVRGNMTVQDEKSAYDLYNRENCKFENSP